jgi:hypothetical protein
MISYSVSLGDLIVAGVAVGSVIYNYAVVQKRVDSISYNYEELRRGRGIIIEGGDWPDTVRRCFGYGRRGG